MNEKLNPVISQKTITAPDLPEENALTEEEKAVVAEFEKTIDISDSGSIMQYGSGAQQKISEFADSALSNVRTMDLGATGEMISGLVSELKNFDTEEKKGFRLFRKAQNKVDALKARYDKAEVSVDKICESLDGHQIQLMKDVAVLDKLYDVNLANFKELSLCIIAGKRKLKEARETTLAEYTRRAEETGLPADAQTASDFAALCDRFEKKLYDLELTRTVSIQMGPQIRLVQNNDTVMAEKIQSTISNTVPLWKSQMVIALGLAHSQEALKAQREVADMTNELLKKNADALKLATVETARENERGIVDIETLTYTNEQLISTLDEVMQIQADGKEKRRSAEAELGRIEDELKNKLLSFSN
ncbi:MAG: toxic anion resistance protein [Firmicutes bacterium]|nr:toxic anion resistance protein [Bacillota bacterium]